MNQVTEALVRMVTGKQLVRNLAILLGMILFFIMFQNAYILPKKGRIDNASRKVIALSKEVNILQTRVEDKRSRAAKEAEVLNAYRRMAEQLESAKRMLPTRENVSELLDNLTAPGKRTGVSVLSLLPFPPEDTPALTRLSFKLQLEGRYRNIGRYMHELQNMDRLILVDNLQLSKVEGEGTRVQAQLLVSTYLLKEVQ